MKKITLFSCLIIPCSALYAAPIVQGNLTGDVVNTAPVVQSTPDATSTATQTATQPWQLYQQIQQLQTQLRQLRGQLEEQNNQIEQLESEIKNRYTDLDQRLELLQQPDSDSEAIEETAPAEPSSVKSDNKDEQLDQAAYNVAYDAYKQGGAAKAIAPMENFIKNHPNSPYVSHAYYWLGEFNLSLTPANFNEAKENFLIVVGNYPKSNKAPSALYRLSEIAKNIDKDIPKARTYYLKLIQNYASSDEAKRARTEINL